MLHAEDRPPQGLPGAVCDVLREVLFYVLPRISPDGAEHVLNHGRFVRSNVRDDRLDEGRSFWRTQDVDGDGLSDVITAWHCHQYGMVWWKQIKQANGQVGVLKGKPNPAAISIG